MITLEKIGNTNQSLDKNLIKFFVDIEDNYDGFIERMVKEFKLIFPDYILDDIFSNQINIKYIFWFFYEKLKKRLMKFLIFKKKYSN